MFLCENANELSACRGYFWSLFTWPGRDKFRQRGPAALSLFLPSPGYVASLPNGRPLSQAAARIAKPTPSLNPHNCETKRTNVSSPQVAVEREQCDAILLRERRPSSLVAETGNSKPVGVSCQYINARLSHLLLMTCMGVQWLLVSSQCRAPIAGCVANGSGLPW